MWEKQEIYNYWEIVLLIILTVIILFNKKENSKNIFNITNEPKLKKENEIKNINFTDFNNGLVKMKLPEGWIVDVLDDYIHYTTKVYNLEKTIYQFFFNMKSEGYNKSEDIKRWQQKSYPNNMFAKTILEIPKDFIKYLMI